MLNSLSIKLNGGRNLTINEEFCSNGADGTLCLIEEEKTKLIVNANFFSTLSPTILQTVDNDLIDEIYFINNAFGSFHMYNLSSESEILYSGSDIYIIDSNLEDFAHSNGNIFLNLNFNKIEIIRSYFS